jgi:hypothetical protein
MVMANVLAAATPPVVIEVAAETGLSAGSLQQQLCGGSDMSSTTLLLGSGVHTIEGDFSCMVANLRNLTILGEEGSRVVCRDVLVGANLIFLNISSLTIGGVAFENCGRVLPHSLPLYVNNTLFYFDSEQKVALLFAQVTDLNLSEVRVTQSYGFGIAGINLRGVAEFYDIAVTDTDNFRHPLCHRNDTSLACSGSGVVLLYSDPDTEDERAFPPSPTTLTVRNCTIIDNENVVPTSRFLPVFLSFQGAFNLDRLLVTGANGLGVYFGQRSYDVNLSILSSVFTRNTGYSSGVAFLLFNTIRDVHIEVQDCEFRENEGSEVSRGGGMVVLVVTYISELGSFPDYPNDVHNLLLVRDSTFVDNFATIGGGGYIYFAPQNISDFSIVFDSVVFISNRANSGTAFEADTRPATFEQKSLHLLMIDVAASNNSLPSQFSTTLENNAAIVLLNVLNATIIGRNDTNGSLFMNNSPGPFLVVGGHLYLQGLITFANNTALRGGAISLYDYALLFIHEGSSVNFKYNSAGQVGGAIFASSPGTGTAPTCVFQVIGPHRVFTTDDIKELELSLNFVGNQATDGGNSVYANPLYGCASLPESSLFDINVVLDSSKLYRALFQFKDPVDNGLSEVSSIPQRVCLCSQGEVLHPEALCNTETHKVAVVPGERFTLQMFPVDLFLNPASSILITTLNSSMHSLARGQASYQLFGGKCTTVDFNIYGPEDSAVSIKLHPQEGTSVFQVHIVVGGCPPGYDISENGMECVCDTYVGVIGSTCSFENYTISRRSNSWLGVIEHVNASDVVYVYTCPTGFCKNDIRFVDLTVPDQLCQQGRTGIMCGACYGNLSAVFGSTVCMECSHYWLLTIFVYAAAGIILIVLLFLLNFNVSQGTLSGISVIFYANIVGVNSSILFPSTNRGFLFVWISLLNLELGFPLCFYDGMTEGAKAGLQCVFPMYLLFMTFLLILLSQHSRRVAKLISNHGIQVLATLLYLSFSKMIRYTIDILSFATLFSEERNHILWLFDGNLEFFTGAHTVIVIVPAAITFFFIVLYLVFLVFIRQFEKCSSRLKPLMDAYGGPFKDRFRFWFGLRLLFLSAMYMTYAVRGTDDPVLSALVQQVFLVILMVSQAFFRPFKNQLLNALDLFYMLNSFFLLLHSVKVQDVTDRDQTMVVTALVSLAFIVFILLIFYHIYAIAPIKRFFEPWIEKIKQLSWPKIKALLCPCCRKKHVETRPPKYNSAVSIAGTDIRQLADISTTEVTLEGSVDADKTRKRKSSYSNWRDSSIEYFVDESTM